MSCRFFLPGPILNRIGPEQSKDNWNLIICQLRQNKSIPDQVQNQFWNCSIEDQTIFRKKSKKTVKPSSVSKNISNTVARKSIFCEIIFFLAEEFSADRVTAFFSKHLWQRMFGPLRYFFDWSHIRCSQDETNLVLNELKKATPRNS